MTALRVAAAELEQAEMSEDLRDDVYASELRGHRHTLETIARRLDDETIPVLSIDEGQLIYCFPFSWRADPDSRRGEDILSVIRDRLAVAPGDSAFRRPMPLMLSDRWASERFTGMVVRLPPLTIRTTAEQVLPAHSVELRFGSRGNHCVRIARTLDGALLHDVNQGLRRASPQMGEENVTDPTGGSWRRLPEYAADVIDDVAALLGAPANPPFDPQGHFHAIVEIRAASRLNPNGARRPARRRDLTDGAGGLLLRSVRPLAGSLEEWVRLSGPNPVPNLVDDAGFDTDLIVRTANTTLLFMPGTPNWSLIGYEEMAEFVASLDPVLLGWQSVLERRRDAARDKVEQVQRAIARSEGENRGRLKADLDARDQVLELEVLRLEHRALVAEVRSDLAIVKSTDLCVPSSNRRLIDRLYEASGMPRREAELDALIEELEALYERAANFVGILDERAQRRAESRLQLLLVGLGILSLSNVLLLLNSLFVPAAHLIGRAWAISEIAILAVLSLPVAVVLVRRVSRKG